MFPNFLSLISLDVSCVFYTTYQVPIYLRRIKPALKSTLLFLYLIMIKTFANSRILAQTKKVLAKTPQSTQSESFLMSICDLHLHQTYQILLT